MIFTKHRFEIWNGTQHPFKHTLGDFSYVNPAAPGSTSLEGALNWIFAVLYPNTKAAVANVAALPSSGNTLNDYRIVFDDGDGKAAGYRWEQREGAGSASWHKIYDMDWGQDSILAAFQNQTQDLYIWKDGRSQLNPDGTVITGLYAGQTVYGGNLANQNLTLRANAGDGTGARTGFVQVDDFFRPAVTNLFDLGGNTFRWKDSYVQGNSVVGTMNLASGVITDSSGAISFDNENLTTTGDITGAVVTGTTSIRAQVAGQTATITPGTYANTTGAITFGANNLSTTGTLAAGVTTLTDNSQTLIFDPEVSGAGRITSSTGTIGFDNENLVTTGTLNVGGVTATQVNVDNLRLDNNTLSITNTNGNLIFQANGAGVIDAQNPMTTLGQTVTGTMTITGQLNIDNLRLDGNVISSTDLNGNIQFTPNGTGGLVTNAQIRPGTDNTLDLGTTALRFNDIFLGGVLGNGTNSMAIGTLLSFRSGVWRDLAQTSPAQNGDSLFYDSSNNVWLASVPDSEVTHASLSGLTTGDAGHTQFALLAGRSGGQDLIGGTAASNNLTFESTSNVTKGAILTKDPLRPFTNASFSGTWSGTDLGGSSNYFRDLYVKGEMRGLRFENFTVATLPSASAQNIGRVAFATDNNKAYIDNGTSFKVLGLSKYVGDVSFDGVVLFRDVTVSSDISDARNTQWQLLNNANNFEIMYVQITPTSASNVRITTNVALPAGSYRLIGEE